MTHKINDIMQIFVKDFDPPFADGKSYYCIGFLYPKNRSIPIEDYFDFPHKQWTRMELLSDLHFSVLPPGLIFRTPLGDVMIVLQNKLFPLNQDFRPAVKKSRPP